MTLSRGFKSTNPNRKDIHVVQMDFSISEANQHLLSEIQEGRQSKGGHRYETQIPKHMGKRELDNARGALKLLPPMPTIVLIIGKVIRIIVAKLHVKKGGE